MLCSFFLSFADLYIITSFFFFFVLVATCANAESYLISNIVLAIYIETVSIYLNTQSSLTR